MATFRRTKLDAVNRMLSLVGEAAVNSLTESSHADVGVAVRLLDEADRAVQGIGWHWNTEIDFEPTQDSANKYPAGADWITFDEPPGGENLVIRGKFLYDLTNRTNVITTALKGELVRFLDFEDMPESARQYIAIKAGRQFLDATLGSGERHGFTREDEAAALAALNHEEARQGDYNYLGSRLAHATIHRHRRALDI